MKTYEKYINPEITDDDIMERMFDLITSLDADQLTEDQTDEAINIIDELDEENEISEFVKIRQKIDRQTRRERKKEYRKKKARLKQKAKRYRKTAAYKKWLKKKKRFAKVGKTATGKRVRKFITS